MEPQTFLSSLGVLTHLEGLALVLSVIALLWYSTFRSQRKTNAETNQQMQELYQKVLEQYKTDLAGLSAQHLQAAKEMRMMYDNNALLVAKVVGLAERFEERGEDLKHLIQTNIQCWQENLSAVKDNQFCPRVRELEGKG